MSAEPLELTAPPAVQPIRTCADCDEDCHDIENKVVCWLYDPGRGMCPYLRPHQDKESRP